MRTRLLVPLAALVLLAGGFLAIRALNQPRGAVDAVAVPSTLAKEPASSSSSPDLATPAASGAGREAVRPLTAAPLPSAPAEPPSLAEAQIRPPEREEPRVAGRVIDAYGNPVAGALVSIDKWVEPSPLTAFMGGKSADEIETDPERLARTDVRGRFAIRRQETDGGDLELTVRARGFQVLRVHHKVVDDALESRAEDFVLATGLVIAGLVVDEAGQPVEGAYVRRAGEAANPIADMISVFAEQGGAKLTQKRLGIRSGADGAFEFAHEPPGPYSFEAEHDNYPLARVDGTSRPTGGVENVVIRFGPSAEIEGVIRGLEPGRTDLQVSVLPLAAGASAVDPAPFDLSALLGAASTPGGRTVDVEEDGRFVARGLEPGGRYELRAIVVRGAGMQEPCSDPIRVEAPSREAKLDYHAGGTLRFRVVDAGTGEAVTELAVRHAWQDKSDLASMIRSRVASAKSKPSHHPEGLVEIRELRPPRDGAALKLSVDSPDHLTIERENVIVPGEGVTDLGVLALLRAPRLRVSVLDAVTGDPIPKARVRFDESGGDSTRTSASGGRGVSFSVTVGDREVDDESGFEFADPRLISGRTDRKGECELAVFPTAIGRLRVHTTRHAPYVLELVSVPQSGVREVEVRLIESGEALVRTVNASGAITASVAVEHKALGALGDDVPALQSSGSDGTVRFRRLAPGRHSFRVVDKTLQFGAVAFSLDQDEDRARDEPGEWRTVEVVSGETAEVVLVVAGRGTLEGLVTVDGRPLAGATIGLVPADIAEDAEDIDLLGAGWSRMLTPGRREADSDSAGRYTVEDVAEGEWLLTVTHPKRALPVRFELSTHGGQERFDVDLTTTGVEGLVVDDVGRPVSGALVRAIRAGSTEEWSRMEDAQRMFGSLLGGSLDGTARTDGAGRFTLEGLPVETELVVRAAIDGHVSANSEEFELAPGETKLDVRVVTPRGGSIIVRLVGDGPPEPFMTLNAVHEHEVGVAGRRFTFASGSSARFDGLPPGRWRVSFDDVAEFEAEEGGPSLPGEVVEVRAGASTEVTLSR